MPNKACDIFDTIHKILYFLKSSAIYSGLFIQTYILIFMRKHLQVCKKIHGQVK